MRPHRPEEPVLGFQRRLFTAARVGHVPMPDYPIYPKTYDLIAYLIPVTQSFPKSQRFVLAKRIQDTALDFNDLLILARKVNPQERRNLLRRADAKLEMLRICLRLAMELKFLPFGQYQHASGMVVEVGRLLGSWRQKLEQ